MMDHFLINFKRFQTMKRFFFIILMAASVSIAKISLPSIISDNMVLQADANAPIWGKAEPNHKVTITCSWSRESININSDSQGNWIAVLRTPKKAKNGTLTIISGHETKIIKNILIGEVWLCSGQSNMEWSVKTTSNGHAEAAKAKYPDIRFFTVAETAAGEQQQDCQGQWIQCNPQTALEFSGVGYYFGRDLYKKLNSPIGLINSSFGGTSAHAWTSKKALENNAILKKYLAIDANNEANKKVYEQRFAQALSKWEEAVKQAAAENKPAPKKPRPPFEMRDEWKASRLYNSMIYPLIPFAIKGVIWYQGESNVDDAITYRTLFPTMITDWRNNWKQGNFPFYFVQISAYGADSKEPGDSNWALLRESQTMALALANTAMAVSMDIGEATNIHPKNKQPVSNRLALLALKKTYGYKKINCDSPLYKSMKKEGNKIRILFDYAESGLKAHKDEPIKGFAIAGDDKKFIWANALIDGSTILVWSEQISKPVAVRYGWADWIECNLYNKKDLPVSPFRTDGD
jgi:hypothetical protein